MWFVPLTAGFEFDFHKVTVFWFEVLNVRVLRNGELGPKYRLGGPPGSLNNIFRGQINRPSGQCAGSRSKQTQANIIRQVIKQATGEQKGLGIRTHM